MEKRKTPGVIVAPARSSVRSQQGGEVLAPLEPLTKKEELRRQKLEAEVDAGLSTFIKVGQALEVIRADRLFKSTHGSFETYCRDRWGMSKTHANRLIASFEVVENLKSLGVGEPVSEAQVRPLTGLNPDQQRKVWGAIVEGTDDPAAVTGNIVTRFIHQLLPHRKRAIGGPGRPPKEEYIRRAQVLQAIDAWWQERGKDEAISDPSHLLKELRELIRTVSVL